MKLTLINRYQMSDYALFKMFFHLFLNYFLLLDNLHENNMHTHYTCYIHQKGFHIIYSLWYGNYDKFIIS